jgi:acyl-CoA synthetase (AMP-forming)/AMP-acid ligase II
MLYAEYRQGPQPFVPDALRVSVLGGEPVTRDVSEMAREMFPRLLRVGALGATECIMLHTGQHSEYLETHPGIVGKPMPGVTAELRDEETGEVVTGPNERGILYVKGPGVAAGIWNDPEATAAAFPDGWWRTGDIFSRDEAGYYTFAGRSDHMFKSGGIKIYSEEVEETLKRHPSVLDAVVVPVFDTTFGLVPFAHVRNTTPLSSEAMEAWWRAQGFEGYSRPRYWRFWDAETFPMVTLAKIDRRHLTELAASEVGEERD